MLWMSRTALELIGQSGLGYSFETFEDENPNEYTSALKEFLCVNSLICVYEKHILTLLNQAAVVDIHAAAWFAAVLDDTPGLVPSRSSLPPAV